jgi:hypothetical protein
VTIDSELRLVAALRRAARARGGPLPWIALADALLDERCQLTGLPRLTRCLGRVKRDYKKAPGGGGHHNRVLKFPAGWTPTPRELYGQLRLDQSRILYPPSTPVPLARLRVASGDQ